jgi:hypothetical protein
MRTNSKFEQGQIQFEKQRNARIQHRQVSDTIAVQWEKPTYMSHIGQNATDKWMKGDFLQSMRDSVKPGQMMTDKVFVEPPEIRLPGAGFGYASIHGSFLHSNGMNVESRLQGLGLSHPHTPAPPVVSSPIPFKTVNTYAPTLGITPAPIQYVKRPGWV